LGVQLIEIDEMLSKLRLALSLQKMLYEKSLLVFPTKPLGLPSLLNWHQSSQGLNFSRFQGTGALPTNA
jgi:hypothetical protein